MNPEDKDDTSAFTHIDQLLAELERLLKIAALMASGTAITFFVLGYFS